MPISFPNLLQESWNFIRNQRAFSLYGVGCLVLLQTVTFLMLPKSANPHNVSLANWLPSLLLGMVNIFLNTLLILNIKAVNNGEFKQFFHLTGAALSAFFPVILLNILIILPLSVGVSFLVYSQTTGENLSLVALPLIVSGIYLFIKSCLVVYAYLLEGHKSVGESVRFTWGLSQGRTLQLVLFCLVAYVVPYLLTGMVGRLVTNFTTLAITILISAFLGLFVTVFSFRFYQAYRQAATNVRG